MTTVTISLPVTPDQFLPLMKASLGVPNTGLNPLAAELFFAVNQIQMSHGVTGNIGEIGVAYGATALFLYQMKRQGESLFLADIFGASGQNPSASFANANTEEHVRQTFQKRLGTDRDIVFIKGPSQELKPGHMTSVRLLHVDAGHAYDEVLGDLRYALSVLHPDGAIVADDMTSETGWRGVYYAVRDFVVTNGLEKQSGTSAGG